MADLMASVQQAGRRAGGQAGGEDRKGAPFSADILERRKRATENLTKASRAARARCGARRQVATEGYRRGDLVLWRHASTCSGEKAV